MTRATGSAAGAFVVGSGRCGSTLVSRLIHEHPALLSISEFFTVLRGHEAFTPAPLDGEALWSCLDTPYPDLIDFLRHVPELEEWPAYWSGAGADAQLDRQSPLMLMPLPSLSERPETLHQALGCFARSLPAQPVSQHYDAIFDWLAREQGRQLWVERSGGSLEYLPLLVKHWPHARYVHVMRDGRDCAISMAKHPFFHVKLARRAARDAALPVAECLRRQVPLHLHGVYWSALMAVAERVLAQVPRERVHVLHYEALLQEPEAQLERLAAFLGVDAPDAWLRRARSLVRSGRSRWSELDPAELARLERACRPGMRVRGQAPSP